MERSPGVIQGDGEHARQLDESLREEEGEGLIQDSYILGFRRTIPFGIGNGKN